MTVDVSFVTSGHDVADARLHRLVAACQHQGLSVEVLGLGDEADAPAGVDARTTPRGSMVRRAALAGRYAGAARGAVLVALDPDSLLASLVVGRARRKKVVADVHEDYPALLRDRPWASGWKGRVGGSIASAAITAAGAADLVVVADEHVPPRDHRARLVVTNLPDLQMLPEPSERSGEPRALYVGDVRGSRGLWTMANAVASVPGWGLDIIGPISDGDRHELGRLLEARQAQDRVRLLGRMPPRRAWAHAREAWCGLSLLDPTPAFTDALPSKVYEYLGSGLGVIASDLPRQASLLRATGAGVVVGNGDDPAGAVARHLSRWLSHPEELDRLRGAARRWRRDVLDAAPYAEFGSRVAALVGTGPVSPRNGGARPPGARP